MWLRFQLLLSLNLLAHIRVATTQSDDPFVWLGAALPDLQREAGIPIGPLETWSGPVRVGIECHRAADAVFHDLPVFLEQSRALTAALLATGVNRGAARGIGHAGWELLFDGALLGDEALCEAYLAAMALSVDDRDWNAALARRTARGVPTIYADPEGVTEILWRVLGQRRLLAFDASLKPDVAAALASAQPAIVDAVDEVLAAVTPATAR